MPRGRSEYLEQYEEDAGEDIDRGPLRVQRQSATEAAGALPDEDGRGRGKTAALKTPHNGHTAAESSFKDLTHDNDNTHRPRKL
jgi:hypothetical protein